MNSYPANKKRCFSQDTQAYIPFAVIGMFILLFAVIASVYIAKTDYELAEVIYTTNSVDMERAAVEFASADLARCLNYAGMESLVWQGEHPVIKPETTTNEIMESDDFSVSSDSRDVEPGDTIKVSVSLPSDAFKFISCLFSDKPRSLTLKSDSGRIYKTIDYNESHSFWSSSSFEEEIALPENAEYGYTYLILEYDNEVKAVNWFHIGSSPLKDITAEYFNEYLQTSYQENQHTFNNYAINIEPNVDPSQIKIAKINGTLKREISRSASDNPDYPIYYTMTVQDLDYTLVDLTTNASRTDSMNVTAIITSREPLLEQLVNEYETELSGGITSDIVLGATNIRTFTYGPWQHYLNGPLNIVTGPSLTASVNAGTLYAQKRIFDSVDPWALTYTTYYNGKVLYNDVKHDTGTYEEDKGSNLSTTYDSLSDEGTFNISVSQGINESMKDANTTMEEVANNSKIVVSVSNFTNEVYSNWVYNDDDVWKSTEYPDLLHDVTHEVYSGTIQGQVFRDGFNEAVVTDLHLGIPWHDSVSSEILSKLRRRPKHVSWSSHYPVSVSHTSALASDYTWNDIIDIDHIATVDPIDGSPYRWELRSANVQLLSSDVECQGIDVTYKYLGNDKLLNMEHTDDYLSYENHSFDWDVTYTIKFKVDTSWEITYPYYWYEAVGLNLVRHSDSSTAYVQLSNNPTVSHTQTETENVSVVYHQYLPSGGYVGLDSVYDSGSANDYKASTVIVDDIPLNDKDCSDAADKYREQEVAPKLTLIQGNYLAYANGTLLPEQKVYCDIPDWLHYEMATEMEEMFSAINTDNPTREISLLGDNLGKNPTSLIQVASLDLAIEMEETSKRESFIQQAQYMDGIQFSTSSDACRAIAKNEAYERLLIELKERNKNTEDSFDDYIDDSFTKEQGHSLLSLLKNKVSTDVLFNNPAMDKASTALGAEMGIIETMEVVGMPDTKYNWTENLTLVVDQYPDYLYHDPDFDLQSQYKWTDESGKEVYPLAVRNVCVFSTGIGDDIAGMLADASEPLKDVISQSMSQSLADANAEVDSLLEDIGSNSAELTMKGVSTDTTLIEENRTKMMDAYSDAIRQQVPLTIASEVAKDPVLSTWVSSEDVNQITKDYFVTLSDAELVNMTSNNTLQDEVFAQVSRKIITNNPSISSNEIDVALYRLEADMQIGVTEGVCVAIQSCQVVIDQCSANINNELQNKLDESTDKLTGQFAEKMEKRLQKSMKMVPCGLPVLPPNWVCTVNVWEYDVKGVYKEFEVIDNDNECLFNPYFGHDAQIYVRKDEFITHPTRRDEDGGFIVIGENQPITFGFSGYAATIVGPGPKGVGDKVGERDEKSIGYEDFESLF